MAGAGVSSRQFAMVAGEASGDLLAGLLIDGLKPRWPEAELVGIGGPQMLARGFQSWWPQEKLAVRGYIEVLRNTPLTLIVLFCSIGLYQNLGLALAPENDEFIVNNNFWLAVLGFTLYTAAFVAESLRSGINTVPFGQAEAARSLGLPFSQVFSKIIFPQAFRAAIIPLGGLAIKMLKDYEAQRKQGRDPVFHASSLPEAKGVELWREGETTAMRTVPGDPAGGEYWPGRQHRRRNTGGSHQA